MRLPDWLRALIDPAQGFVGWRLYPWALDPDAAPRHRAEAHRNRRMSQLFSPSGCAA